MAAPDARVAIRALVTLRIMATVVLALLVIVRRRIGRVIAGDGARHAGISGHGADDAGRDEQTHHALGQNTHIKSFPGHGASFPSGTGRFEGRTSRARKPLHEPERSEEHTSELQSLMRISYAVFCLKKKKMNHII